MYEIRINLNQAASLAPLAVPAGGVAALPVGMPAGPGIYLIYNENSDTRYMGISANIQTRFTGRMAVVNELGLRTADMNNLYAFWGTIGVRRFQPANFAAALPAHWAGRPAGALYGLPGFGAPPLPAPAAPTLCANSMPLAAGPAIAAAFAAAVTPITNAVTGWIAAAPTAAARLAAVTLAAPAGFAPAINAAITTIRGGAAAGAGAAAALPFLAAVPAPAWAVTLAADIEAAVRSHGAAFPIPAMPAPVIQNPVAGAALTFLAAGGALIQLEQVFIGFVMRHLLAAPAPVANGLLTAPQLSPLAAEPILVTWENVAVPAAGIAVIPAFTRSMMWWPGTSF